MINNYYDKLTQNFDNTQKNAEMFLWNRGIRPWTYSYILKM